MLSAPDPREVASMEPSEPVVHSSSVIQKIYPAQFKFDKQHGYTMVKGVYSRMIRNLQLSGGSQNLKYIHALLMYPEFVLMYNIMPQIMVKLSQMLEMSQGDFDTPTLTEAITGPYNADFMQAMTH